MHKRGDRKGMIRTYLEINVLFAKRAESQNLTIIENCLKCGVPLTGIEKMNYPFASDGLCWKYRNKAACTEEFVSWFFTSEPMICDLLSRMSWTRNSVFWHAYIRVWIAKRLS